MLCITGTLAAQTYTPPGYGLGSSSSSDWGASLGYTEIEGDYYVTISPSIEFPLGDFKVGLKIPLEVLVYDADPSTGEDIPSLKPGQYDTYDDVLRLVQYVSYGTHLYYDPGDLFNWSMYYGKMLGNGYLGHKTLIYRYTNNYDDDVFRAGLMADINSNWGGVEYFSSDIWRREVVGWRGYIRPWGWITGIHDIFFVSRLPSLNHVALSMYDRHATHINRGVFYQEKVPEQGKGGRIGQHFLPKIRDVVGEPGNLRFEEVRDPVTGETTVQPVPIDTRSPEQKILDQQKLAEDDNGEEWGHGFWNRFAIGYSYVEDKDAPLTLETDGSGNLVIDPDLLQPRADVYDTLTFVGYDAEFRLSPAKWLELTPYVDQNRIRDVDGAEATHAGIDAVASFSSFKISFRPEYREFASNYLPVYFDHYHVIERTQYNPGGDGDSSNGSGSSEVTKLSYLRGLESGGGVTKGYFAQIIVEWVDTIIIETTYEDYDGLNNSVIFTGIYIPAIADIFFNGYYTKKNFDNFKESFEYDDRSLAAAELGYSLFGGVTVSVRYQRTWVYNSNTGSFEAVDETSYNVGYSSLL